VENVEAPKRVTRVRASKHTDGRGVPADAERRPRSSGAAEILVGVSQPDGRRGDGMAALSPRSGSA
jgi:hypothetical protein